MMESEQFLLVTYVDNHIPEKQLTKIKSAARDLFSESNIVHELVNIETQNNHPALAYLSRSQVKSYPAAVLVSPDGRSLPITLEAPDQSPADRLINTFRKVVHSAIRETLKQNVSAHYAVVLLIEGRDKVKNDRAKHAVEEALVRVKKNMDLMPKLIKKPPVMITLKYKSLADDPVLLWTLGLEMTDVGYPHAAIFYGKARWLGPLFKDEEITRNNLSEILFVVGADCECGMDKNWLRGTMLPMGWNKKDREAIAADLDFDPENPLIKAEIIHIMRSGILGMVRPKKPSITDSLPGDRDSTRLANNSSGRTTDQRSELSPPARQSPLMQSYLLAAVILFSLLASGLFLLLYRSHKNKQSLQGPDLNPGQ